jgi:hypothetical protein
MKPQHEVRSWQIIHNAKADTDGPEPCVSPCWSMCLPSAWQHRNTARVLRLKVRSQSSSEHSSAAWLRLTPALLIAMSRPPSSFTTRSTMLRCRNVSKFKRRRAKLGVSMELVHFIKADMSHGVSMLEYAVITHQPMQAPLLLHLLQMPVHLLHASAFVMSEEMAMERMPLAASSPRTCSDQIRLKDCDVWHVMFEDNWQFVQYGACILQQLCACPRPSSTAHLLCLVAVDVNHGDSRARFTQRMRKRTANALAGTCQQPRPLL